MVSRFCGVLIIGVVIKIMDDVMDQNIDRLNENWNIANLTGCSSLFPYTLFLLILAVYLNCDEAIGYFTASYLVGMNGDMRIKLPTYILAWQEGIIIFMVGVLTTSFFNSLGCLLLIFLLQITDDLIDYKKEKYIKYKNYVSMIGKVNVILIIIIITILIFLYYQEKALYFLPAVLIIYIGQYMLSKKLYKKINNRNGKYEY